VDRRKKKVANKPLYKIFCSSRSYSDKGPISSAKTDRFIDIDDVMAAKKCLAPYVDIKGLILTKPQVYTLMKM